MKYQIIIIGGGIVGIATGLRYKERLPESKVLILEKEPEVATHQTGHNSGVIHAGVYYKPGSLKAVLCRKGARLMTQFCEAEHIPYENLGKLIVATNAIEVQRLQGLKERSTANGIRFEVVDKAELARREPAITGEGALFFPETSIVDYRAVAQKMAEKFRSLGGELRTASPVTAIAEHAEGVVVHSGSNRFEAERLIVCGGAQADRLAQLAGLKIDFRIVPFRGEYYQIDPKYRGQVNHLIYPVPDPALPFLGIHLTHEMNGRISVGPNAVLGMSREDTRNFAFNARDFGDIVTYPGFWRFLAGNIGSGLAEFRNSISKTAYLRECRKYLPALKPEEMKAKKAGVRAQVIMKDGSAVQDFLTLQTGRMVHICNAPSPAATSSLAIADYILDTYLPH